MPMKAVILHGNERHGNERHGEESGRKDRGRARKKADRSKGSTAPRSILNALLDSSQHGILVTDSTWSLIEYNERFLELWRVPEEFFLDKTISVQEKLEAFRQKVEDLDYFDDSIARLRADAERLLFDQVRLKDGRVIERISRPFYDTDGNPAGRLWYFREVLPNSSWHEQQLNGFAHAMQREKSESLRLMAGSVAHHVNNHLFTIMSSLELAQLMLERKDADRCYKYLERSKGFVDEAMAFTYKMLSYLGHNNIREERVRVDRFLAHIVQSIKEQIPKHVKVEIKASQRDARLHAWFDPALIGECIRSIIFNSLEAIGNEEGEIGIAWEALSGSRIAPPSLPLMERGGIKGKFLSIAISDNGPGMDKRALSRAFDPFFTTKEFGRGLGLSSVLGIVRSHKGYVGMVSKRSEGTTTTIYLPLRERDERGSATLRLISG